MRTVTTENSTTIAPEQCTLTSYYAAQMLDTKAFIVRENFDRGNFQLCAMRKLTNGNKYSLYFSESLAGLINQLIQYGYEVLEFTEQNEFLEWLKN
jgi:hypothetical protein